MKNQQNPLMLRLPAGRQAVRRQFLADGQSGIAAVLRRCSALSVVEVPLRIRGFCWLVCSKKKPAPLIPEAPSLQKMEGLHFLKWAEYGDFGLGDWPQNHRTEESGGN